ncbi:uncharacterized protein LOC127172702 [Labeo rohita]|uniref:uncharacterized protein LOC127172702 n=1 Tax=Labeo rohita TaxID=84645 RepID=UPI0021E2B518|nr:uncharacterized protein LOC127172702 [Labeo rohita]
MVLLILLIFLHFLEVQPQSLPQAKLTIFPTFATDEEEVQMVCGGHENQHMSECTFYPAGQENFIKPSASCNFFITVADLIAWSQDQESSYVNISCYYTVHSLGENTTSPHSDIVSVRIRVALAITSSTEIITDPITASLESTMLTDITEHASALTVTSSTENTTDLITNMSSLTTSDSNILTDPANVFPGMTEAPEIKKYSKMFFFFAVVATSGGIVLTVVLGSCLYGCTRKSKTERIWIKSNSKKHGPSLPMASSDSSGEGDALLYTTINFIQFP